MTTDDDTQDPNELDPEAVQASLLKLREYAAELKNAREQQRALEAQLAATNKQRREAARAGQGGADARVRLRLGAAAQPVARAARRVSHHGPAVPPGQRRVPRPGHGGHRAVSGAPAPLAPALRRAGHADVPGDPRPAADSSGGCADLRRWLPGQPPGCPAAAPGGAAVHVLHLHAHRRLGAGVRARRAEGGQARTAAELVAGPGDGPLGLRVRQPHRSPRRLWARPKRWSWWCACGSAAPQRCCERPLCSLQLSAPARPPLPSPAPSASRCGGARGTR